MTIIHEHAAHMKVPVQPIPASSGSPFFTVLALSLLTFSQSPFCLSAPGWTQPPWLACAKAGRTDLTCSCVGANRNSPIRAPAMFLPRCRVRVLLRALFQATRVGQHESAGTRNDERCSRSRRRGPRSSTSTCSRMKSRNEARGPYAHGSWATRSQAFVIYQAMIKLADVQ